MPTAIGHSAYGTVDGHRQLVYGQIRNPAAAKLVVHWKGGDAIEIPIGVDGFFLGEVPLARLDPAAAPEWPRCES